MDATRATAAPGPPARRIRSPDRCVIGDAEILVSQYAGLLPGRSFTELRLRGLELTLERADDGRWRVRGLPGEQQPGGDPLSTLERLGELQVIGGRLSVIAPALGIDATLPRIDLRLQRAGRPGPCRRARVDARGHLAAGRSAGFRSQRRQRPRLCRCDAGGSCGLVADCCGCAGVQAGGRARTGRGLGGAAGTPRRHAARWTRCWRTSHCAAWPRRIRAG